MMTRDQAIEIARRYALRDGADELHAYLPRTDEEAAMWDPHAWVVDAIRGASSELELVEADGRDADRFRWLTEDHGDAETRAKCRELLGRLGVMGRGSARADIDSAMADDIKRSMLRTADARKALEA